MAVIIVKREKTKKQSAVIFQENKALPLNRGNPGKHTFQPLKIWPFV